MVEARAYVRPATFLPISVPAIIEKRIFMSGRRIGRHHPRRRRNHPSDYPWVWRLLTTPLQPMAALT